MSSQNVKIKSFNELSKITTSLPPNSLFIFDIDNVLTMPSDPHMQLPTLLRFRSDVKTLFGSLTTEELDLFYALAVTESEQSAIEECSAKLLNEINQQGHRIMALTAIQTGVFNGVDIIQWRLEALRLMGIDFSSTFAHVESFILEEFDYYLGRKPMFSRGVLFSNGFAKYDKGLVLKSFLSSINEQPPHLVLIDDLEENLAAVQQMAVDLSIPYLGIHYLGAHFTLTPEVKQETALSKWETFAKEAKRLATLHTQRFL